MNNSKKRDILLGIGKLLGGLVLFVSLIFLFAYFALQYGLKLDGIANSFHDYWFVWFLVRVAIYIPIGILLFKIYKRTKKDAQGLVRAAVIGIVVIELINIMQLRGE